ncbi:Esterase/lipase/thioesterase [Heterobasidion irregulare TC 32-1]|uniref:Carboxylic ester hydrolase n=1 Tax=Heterobasidion irregulare (strain TC 32-1) TaxID=747525 RepID=W4K910_HETIT|nr:Esterase/lipase/thioesterase [Heterobasidion irregulare TC 32-1]ETW82244.1 Esterase/lipase/thioesterase [Heterobasidion irregulare TC 32-1]
MALSSFILHLALLVASFPSFGAAIGSTVRLDAGTFVGTPLGNMTRFLGVPYALPPTGNLRFRLPVPNLPYRGTHNATQFALACPQQSYSPTIPNAELGEILSQLPGGGTAPSGEDCLYVNVWSPANATSYSKLPVLFWIHGGGWEVGETSLFDGSYIVQKSLDIGTPVVFVSTAYRLNSFGFLASKEVKRAGVGNLGMQDQRQALRWVQKYIHAFGGDPKKVTLWGESAGGVSIGNHMITNNGNTEGLFRAGIMHSGSPQPMGDITNGQPMYDYIVDKTGCTGARDTLQCLREVPFESLSAATNSTPSLFNYSSLNLVWQPRTDGVFLKENPQTLIAKGVAAKLPFINGDCDDEGTLFSLSSTNLTTDQETHDYIHSNYYSKASSSEITQLMQYYPPNPVVGSPFDTGDNNTLTPQYKRISALTGDIIFEAPRRFFLDYLSSTQPAWAFQYKRFKSTPYLGTYHLSDLYDIFGPPGDDFKELIVRFAVHLDPNGGTNATTWPKWTKDSPNLLTLLDGAAPISITQDTYRSDGIDYLKNLSRKYPF